MYDGTVRVPLNKDEQIAFVMLLMWLRHIISRGKNITV